MHALRYIMPLGAAAILLSAGLSSPAEAGWHGPRGYGYGHGYGHGYHRGGYASWGYASAPVFIEPEPVYYAPEPVVTYGSETYYDNNAQPQQPQSDRYCREYTGTGYVGGTPQSTYGTACMQPDGSWELQN